MRRDTSEPLVPCRRESSTADSSSFADSLLRKHTISGELAFSPSPVKFIVHISVREPTAPLDEAEEAKRDPGREYVVEKMECEVKGGGSELRDALSRCVDLLLSPASRSS